MPRALWAWTALLLCAGGLPAREDKPKPEPAAPRASARSPDGKLKASADGKSVVLVNTATGKEVRKVTAHTADVSALAFSPDGRALFSGDAGGTVCKVDLATGKVVWKHAGKVTKVDVSPDGRTVTATAGGKASQYDALTGKKLAG
jgi:WD40 repeat protein